MNITVETGRNLLLLSNTFADDQSLIEHLTTKTESGYQTIAHNVHSPSLMVERSQSFYIDPSIVMTLDLSLNSPTQHTVMTILRLKNPTWITQINQIYTENNMPPLSLHTNLNSPEISYFIALDGARQAIGIIIFVDHSIASLGNDNACSFWGLAVKNSAKSKGVGRSLILHTIRYAQSRQRSSLELSVLTENIRAIRLYEQLNFQPTDGYTLKSTLNRMPPDKRNHSI